MDTVTILYKFVTCPNLDQPLLQLEELGFSILNNSDLEGIRNFQQNFCEKYNLPFLSLVPYLTTYIQLDGVSSDHHISNPRERYYYFPFGIMYWEVTYETDLPSPVPPNFVRYISIKEKSTFSAAIFRKKRLCLGKGGDNEQCSTCKTTNVYKDIKYLTTSRNDIYQHFSSKPSIAKKYQEYEVRGHHWVIRKHDQVLLSTSTSSTQLTKSIRQWNLISSTILFSVRNSGDERMTRLLERIILFMKSDNLDFENVEIYISHFLYRYILTSPEFILEKQNIRLHLPDLLLKSLNYVYDGIEFKDTWNIDTSKLKELPVSLLIITRLFITLRKVPHPIFLKWANLLNPFNSYILHNSMNNLADELDNEDRHIVLSMARELVESRKMTHLQSLPAQAQIEARSVNGIAELLDVSGGRKYYRIKNKIERLARLDILVESSPEELNTTRGPAQTLYFLNPQIQFTQFLIQLTQIYADEEDLDVFETIVIE